MYHRTQVHKRKQPSVAKTRERKPPPSDEKIIVERVQTGVRLEKRLLKVLKGLAEYHDMTLGDLLEGIVLHAFDGRHPFGDETRQRIADLKRIYKLDLDADASHRLLEAEDREGEAVSKSVRGRKKR
jgi:hypothetical protein